MRIEACPIPLCRVAKDRSARTLGHEALGAGLLLLPLLMSCTTTSARVSNANGPAMQEARLTPYDGPKARIAIADFEDKTSSSGLYRADFGRGLSDMLSTALFQSNRFVVLDRSDIGAVLEEQNFGRSGRVDASTAVAAGQLEGAELLVKAAITGFDPDAGGIAGGGGGLFGKVLGGVSGSAKKATIAMDLKVVEVRTGRIVAATSVAGEARSFGVGLAGLGGSMGGGLGAYANSPMESAIREMVQAAVGFLSSQTPDRYFHDEPEPIQPAVERNSTPEAPEPASAALPYHPLATVAHEEHKELEVDLVSVERRGETIVVRICVRNPPARGGPEFHVFASSATLLDYGSGTRYRVSNVDGGGILRPGERVYLTANFTEVLESATQFQVYFSDTATLDDLTAR